MKGIYKITNNINNKSYIGKSSDIEERWNYHISRYNQEKEWDKPLYRAFRKYGIENFSFEILEILENEYDELANQREKYWIAFYQTYGATGYNGTQGGDGGQTVSDPRKVYGKLTAEEVIYLRQRYLECKYPPSYIYAIEFKNKITLRGFQAIWLGQNAKDIMPEVFTEENKKKQIKLARAYEGVLRRKIKLEEKRKIKERIANGEKCGTIWREEYQYLYSTPTGFRDMLKAISLDEEVDLNGKELDPLSL